MSEVDAKVNSEAAVSQSDERPEKVRFHYVKSNYFRTIHADGVFGGATPRGDIAASFFNERRPLPDQTAQKLSPEGQLGEEIMDERIERDGILRELEVNVVIDLAFAKTLVKWLNDKIAFVEKSISELAEHKEDREGDSNACN